MLENEGLLVIFIILYIQSYILAKLNRLDAASNTLVIITTIVTLTFVWKNEGIRDEIMLVSPVIAAFAVLLGSSRLFYTVVGILIVNILIIGYLNEINYIQHNTSSGGISSAILIVIIFSVISYSIKQLGNALNNSMDELNTYKGKLETQVE